MSEEKQNEEIKTEPRDINVLLHIPYSEMSDAEIESLIEWKSDVKAQDAKFQLAMQQQREISNALREEYKKEYEDAKSRQTEFYNSSLKRLKKATEASEAIIKERHEQEAK